MKKIFPFLFIAILILLAGCSNLPGIDQFLATPTSTPTDTPTPQPTVTLIPTTDFFAILTSTPVTFTPTSIPMVMNATITPLPTDTPIPTNTPIPLPTFSEEFINDNSKVTFFNDNVGFKTITYSSPTLYWDKGACSPRDIKLTVTVYEPDLTDRVFLFMRLRDKQNTLNLSEWSAGAQMIKLDDGTFNYDIETRHLRRYFYYKNAWLEYQLVSVNEKNEIIGRTQLYDRQLSLVKCGL
jgi:hypothetical protein